MAPKGLRLKQNHEAQQIDILKGKFYLIGHPVGKFQVLLSTEHEIDFKQNKRNFNFSSSIKGVREFLHLW